MSAQAERSDFDVMDAASVRRVERAIEAVARGEMVILTDDEDRENEGDLIMAAEKITAEDVNFMAGEARGLICLAMTGERLDELGIPMMVSTNQGPYGTAFTVSIEARTGVTTGISAADRARTVQVAVADDTTPDDLVMPGHVFPLRARDGGVLVRTGQTEGSVDLARLAGLKPAAVICEIMNPDGTMARRPELEKFADEHELVLVSVADVIGYRLQRESLVEKVADEPLETEWDGDWRVHVFRSRVDDAEHLCFVCGKPRPDEPTLVRVQHRVDTFELFTSRQPEPMDNLRGAMQAMSEAGTGVIVYLDREGSSASDVVKKHVGKPQESDAKQVPSHQTEDVNKPKEALRNLGIGSQILLNVGVRRMRVMTNRPKRIIGSQAYGLEVVEQVPIPHPEPDPKDRDRIDPD
jgi:3,4-dihydroxy 2-butanone 4-phosphate synthase/GTP cyclohydrolase II